MTTQQTPDWIDETPEELPTKYEIVMWVGEGDEQNIGITRAEYIALKQHLAKLRGYDVPPDDEPPAAAEQLEAEETADETQDEESADRDLELLVSTCRKLLKRNRGLYTPFEDFLSSVLFSAVFSESAGHNVSPKHIEGNWETFCEDYEDLATKAKAFIERMPPPRKELAVQPDSDTDSTPEAA